MPGGPETVKALIFDYDGLIVDSESPEFESWQKVYAEHGQSLDLKSWVHFIGGTVVMDPKQDLEQRVGRSLDWKPIQELRLKHHHELMASKAILPGVATLMESARAQGWKVGVASSSSSSWVEGGLERFGLLRYVQTIRTRDRVQHLKPHPEPYLSALADLGSEAAGSFAFEDSKIGVASAKAAGLTVIAVPNDLTRLQDLSAADRILDSLEHFSLPEQD
jgi:HAD superfamily hydrolase (TIGR01509 family)